MELNMPQSLATCHLRRAVALGDIDAMLMLADLELKNGIPHIYFFFMFFFFTHIMLKANIKNKQLNTTFSHFFALDVYTYNMFSHKQTHTHPHLIYKKR
jgi:hypothetical protein